MRISVIVAMVVVPGLLQAQARMEDDGMGPRVVASASRVARIAADRVILSAIAEGAAETPAEANQRADRKLQAILEAVRQSGGRAEVVSSTPFGIMNTINFNGYPGQTSANPYTARYIVQVRPARMDQLMSLSSAIVAAGGTMAPPTFESAAADSARRAKFADALAQARADAEALAAGVGMRLGSLIEVSATQSPSPTQYGGSYVSFMRGFPDGPMSMPETVVTANVTVRYRLVPR